jgi:hypothetical protein
VGGVGYAFADDTVPEIPEPPTQDESLRTKPSCQADFVEKYGKVFLPQPQIPIYRRFYYYLHKLVDAQVARVLGRLDGVAVPRRHDRRLHLGPRRDARGARRDAPEVAQRLRRDDPRAAADRRARVIAAGRVDHLSSHVDLLPTLLGLAGLDAGALARPRCRDRHTEAQPLVGRDLSGAGARRRGERRADLLHDRGRGVRGARPDLGARPQYEAVEEPAKVEAVLARLDVGDGPAAVEVRAGVPSLADRRSRRRLAAARALARARRVAHELYDLDADPLETVTTWPTGPQTRGGAATGAGRGIHGATSRRAPAHGAAWRRCCIERRNAPRGRRCTRELGAARACDGVDARVPAALRAQVFAAREAHGLVWVWWGAPRATYPEVPWLAEIPSDGANSHDAAFVWPVPAFRAIESMFDFHHAPVLHGRASLRLTALSRMLRQDGAELVCDDAGIDFRCVMRAEDRRVPVLPCHTTFRVPGLSMLRLGDFGRTAVFDTPIDAATTWRFTRTIAPFGRGLGLGKAVAWLSYVLDVRLGTQFREDLPMVVTQAHPAGEHFRDIYVKADAAIAQYVRLRRALLRAARERASEFPPSVRLRLGPPRGASLPVLTDA